MLYDMPLLAHLPNEVLLLVAEQLASQRAINALAQTSTRLYGILNAYLYRYDAKHHHHHHAGSAVLWAARYSGEPATVQRALAAGAGVDANGHGHCHCLSESLSWAARMGHEDVAKLLLGVEGVDPDDSARNAEQETPLCLAAKCGRTGIVALLLLQQLQQTGGGRVVNPEAKNVSRQTPLLLAAQGGHKGVVAQLLETEGVDPGAKDIYGQTPLSVAAGRGHEEVVRLLLDTNAVNPEAKDIHGQTPLSKAAWYGHEAVVGLLRSYGGLAKDMAG